ncbi:hypothetical protein M0R04_14410 [Candidatus Dojkabacteria bacterium]|jgi:hypothetical protein|nr:hypothetical protein [Candidatus Dojkabacteria bacterium]
MKYILLDTYSGTYEEFDTLEDARAFVIEKIDDNDDDDVTNYQLVKVSDEYEIISSKRVLFKKVGSEKEE